MKAPKHTYLASVFTFLSIVGLPLFAFAVSESAARVRVAATDELGQPYRECRIALLSTKNKQVFNDPPPDLPYLDAQVLGTFITTFILPPRPEFYLLRIACEGSNETFTSGPTVLPNPKTPFPTPVDLGIVRLKREKEPRN